MWHIISNLESIKIPKNIKVIENNFDENITITITNNNIYNINYNSFYIIETLYSAFTLAKAFYIR